MTCSRRKSSSPPKSVSPARGRQSRSLPRSRQSCSSRKGKVVECKRRGFAFVLMDTVEDANRCIKYLNRSVLKGRLITVEKAKRKPGRTPTPGRYEGARDKRGVSGSGRRRSRSYSPQRVHEKDHQSRDRSVRSRPPYSRKENDYSHRRGSCRDPPRTAGGSSYRRLSELFNAALDQYVRSIC